MSQYTMLDQHPRPTNPEELKATGLAWFPHHDCSLCGVWVGYKIEPGAVFFHGGCACCSGSMPRESSWEEIAEHYNMQRSDVAISDIAKRWSLPDPIAEVQS